MATFLGIVAFVLLLFFLIMFHEFGHFITARWAGIKVSKFFLGFGPTLWSYRRGREEKIPNPDDPMGGYIVRPETEYGIKPILVGGFVKVVGMSPAEEVSPEDEPRSFDAAPTWKRAIVLAAGSVTHFITAFFVLFLIFAVIGLPDIDRPKPVVDAIAKEVEGQKAPAAIAGLQKGDEVIEVDGRRVRRWEDVRDGIRSNPGRTIELTLARDGKTRTVEVKPIKAKVGDETVGLIGVQPSYQTERLGPLTAIGRSGTVIKQLLVGGRDADGEPIRGFFQQLPRAFSPGSLGLRGGGPTEDRPVSIIGAGRIAVDFASQGQIPAFLLLFAQINIFVAVFNMLPLPPLDGGHLLILGLGKLRGRPVDPKAVMPVMAVVFSLLVVLGVLLDLLRRRFTRSGAVTRAREQPRISWSQAPCPLPNERQLRRSVSAAVEIGGDAPVSIQSMTTTRTQDPRATVDQALGLATAGADIVRVTVNDDDAADGLALILWVLSSSERGVPIIADIHFRPDLALRAIEYGVQGLRLNPGNIKDAKKIREIAREAKDRGIPIRVGANAGSLHSQFMEKHGGPTPEALVESAMWEVALLEEEGFTDIKISVKHSNAWQMIESYRLLSRTTDYPLHLGVTEAGTTFSGGMKSAVGIGTLLAEGIGDTIRVSLAADPLEEVKAGKAILQSLGLRREGVDVVACPTCGRVEGDVITMANRVEEALA